MNSHSSTEDNVATQKILALVGTLCILYLLFSPSPGARDSSEYVNYMVTGGGEQWAFLGFSLLTAILVFFRFWKGALISACGLIGTQILLAGAVLLKNFLIWIITISIRPGSQIDFGIFDYVLKFLVKVLFPPPPFALGFSSFFFQTFTLMQQLLLITGTILSFVAPFQAIRIIRNK